MRLYLEKTLHKKSADGEALSSNFSTAKKKKWDISKAVIKGNFIAVSACIKNQRDLK
jgi:hypothetical protein